MSVVFGLGVVDFEQISGRTSRLSLYFSQAGLNPIPLLLAQQSCASLSGKIGFVRVFHRRN